MALPCEIGLYFDFDVTDDGVPYGCPGLDNFNPTTWNQSNTQFLLIFRALLKNYRALLLNPFSKQYSSYFVIE